MDVLQTVLLETKGASFIALQKQSFFIRQGSFLIQLDQKLKQVKKYDTGKQYSGEPLAIYNDSLYEFRYDATLQINLESFEEKILAALPNSNKAQFTQIGYQLFMLTGNQLIFLNLIDMTSHQVAILPFELNGALFPYSGKRFGILHQDDFYTLDTQSSTISAFDCGNKCKAAVACGYDQFLTFKKRTIIVIDANSKTQSIIARSRGSFENSYPYSDSGQLLVVDDQGTLLHLRGDFSEGVKAVNSIKISPGRPITFTISTNRDRYDVFASLLQEYITAFKEQQELVKSDALMLSTCYEINELIRAVHVREISKMKTDTKRRILEIIRGAMIEHNLQQSQLVAEIARKQAEMKDYSEKISQIKLRLSGQGQEQDDKSQFLKELAEMRQQEMDKIQAEIANEKRRRLEGKTAKVLQNRSVVETLQEKAKQQLEARRKAEDEKRREEEAKKKLADEEEARIKLIEAKKAEEQRAIERQQREKEEAIKEEKRRQITAQIEEEERKKREKFMSESKLMEQRKELELKRKAEIEQEVEGKKSAKVSKNVDVNQYDLFASGDSVTFIVSAEQALVRQGSYLFLINFQIYRVEQLLTLPEYSGQPAGFFRGRYIELGQQPFVVDLKSFERTDVEAKISTFGPVTDFCQVKNELIILSANTVLFDLVTLKQTATFDASFTRCFPLKAITLTRGEDAFEYQDGRFVPVEYNEVFKHKIVRLSGSKLVSLDDNKLFVDNEAQFASVHTLERARCCLVGRVVMLADDAGVLVTVTLK